MIPHFRLNEINWRLFVWRLIAWGLLGGLALYTVWPWLPGTQVRPTRTIIVYGFSILGEVMNDGVFPAFQAEWQTQTGERVEVISAFAGSGTVTNQIMLGVPAEVALLSTELDARKLAERGVVSGLPWQTLPYSGTLNRTPFVILVRPGNPKHITDFRDLIQAGVGVVHPDPLTSGGAQWAILAEYGSALTITGDKEQAYQQLRGIWQNVVAQAASARAARTQFENGFGDALITYEQEGVFDLTRGRLDAEIVYPYSTILSEHTVVVVDKNVPPADRELVQAFVAFLWSDQAQRVFVEHGFRSVSADLNDLNSLLRPIAQPFTVTDLGGWPQAKRAIIDAIWKQQVLPGVGK